jgi:serine/threonine protein kinase
MSEDVAGFDIGGVIGIGTYGEVRAAVDLETGHQVALKIVDLSRFQEETANLMFKEIKILKMIDHKYCIKVLNVKRNVPYEGTWCDTCACTEYSALAGGVCANCSHYEDQHSPLVTRSVLLIIQQLAAGGITVPSVCASCCVCVYVCVSVSCVCVCVCVCMCACVIV